MLYFCKGMSLYHHPSPTTLCTQELEIFVNIDAEHDWPCQPPDPWEPGAVPSWVSYTPEDVRHTLVISQKKPSATGEIAARLQDRVLHRAYF
jgi:hypothetical protein